jgi:transposase
MTARQHPPQADITEIDAQIEAEIAPFADAAARLNEIRSVGLFAAHTIIAGIGLDMNRFPRSRALVLLGQAPHPEGIRRHEEGLELHWPRQPLPGRVLGEAAVAPARPLSLGERYRRIARCRGKKKAVVAVSAPSWPSSDTCYLTPPPGYATSAPASTTPASSPTAKSATTSGSSKPSATASPSNPPPD